MRSGYEEVFYRPLPPGYIERQVCLVCGKPVGSKVGMGGALKCPRGCEMDDIGFMVYHADGTEITAEERAELFR